MTVKGQPGAASSSERTCAHVGSSRKELKSIRGLRFWKDSAAKRPGTVGMRRWRKDGSSIFEWKSRVESVRNDGEQLLPRKVWTTSRFL